MAFGRLERTEGPRPMSDINVTPLVDVMLVLVVILIITAPLMASSLRLDLPRAEGVQPSDTPKFVSIGIDPAGRTFFNDQPVTTEQLAQRLADAARQAPDTEVQLRADRTVPYGKVVEVMGAAQKAGLNRIGFVAEPTQ
jgi:biopolymer transport protein TolR